MNLKWMICYWAYFLTDKHSFKSFDVEIIGLLNYKFKNLLKKVIG